MAASGAIAQPCGDCMGTPGGPRSAAGGARGPPRLEALSRGASDREAWRSAGDAQLQPFVRIQRKGSGSYVPGPTVAVYCAGPSVERVRPLKQRLEDLGAKVVICTDTDTLGGRGPSLIEEFCRTPSSVSSTRDPRTPLRCLDRGWRTPDGPEARSPDRSPERAMTLTTSTSSVQDHLGEGSPRSPTGKPPHCDAVLVLWSQFFHGSLQRRMTEMAERAGARGAVLLNDVASIFAMQDRRWLLRKLKENGIDTPYFLECSRDGGVDPALEEHSDFILIGGQRINKPFIEKPVDRRDREIYVYFPKDAGGGRAIVSTQESGDVEYICRFDNSSRVRREGSFVYQEYTQSDGLVVQAVCCGGMAYGAAVQSGVTNAATAAPRRAGGAGEWNWGGACPVFLRQEEKQIAVKLSMLMQQTLFGITFARGQAGAKGGELTSYVVDVWPGIPRTGFGIFYEDVSRALLAAMRKRLPAPRSHMRSRSMPRFEKCAAPPVLERTISRPLTVAAEADAAAGVPAAAAPASASPAEDDTLCLLLLCRHGARTPKQKAKTKVKLPSEFAAGWLCGWLAGSALGAAEATEPPATFDLRAPDQLARLNDASGRLQAGGHSLGTFSDALANFDQLGEACHARLGRDAHVLTMCVKWGGELTDAGIAAAEAFGSAFRKETCDDFDVGSVRHDTKVYSSREPRCQQTAAAFCKGFLRLHTPALPPVIAAMVRKDETGALEAGEGGKNYTGNGGEEEEATSALQLDSLETSWAELEADMGDEPIRAAFLGAVAAPALQQFPAPGPALRRLAAVVEEMLGCLAGAGPKVAALHCAESKELLCERYRDVLKKLELGKHPQSFQKVSRIFDHLEYDSTHNLAALPPDAREALEAALPLCQALCDAQSALEVARRAADDEGPDLPFLRKLRADLRVASGEDIGEEKTHLSNHAHFNGGREAETHCVRTRLYFCHQSHIQGLLIALSRPRRRKDSRGACRSDVGHASAAMAARLGFLAHFMIRLSRQRATGQLRVSCHFRRSENSEKVCVFDLPFIEVDAWFTELLKECDGDKVSRAMPTL